jgi:phage FluMu gp28-like protein
VRVEVTLKKPHSAQQAVLNSAARFRVMMCGRRFGKSLISQDISIDRGINKEFVAYITPTYQLGKIFFQEVIKCLPPEIYRKNEADLVINFITGGSIRFFTGERLDAMRGLKFHLVIIDEASYIPNLQDGWNNSIRPTLTDYKGKAIFLSTPKGRNFFYSLYMKTDEPEWESFKFTTYDNPHIDPSEIDAAREQLPNSVFEQEYMANPMENAANPFGSEHINKCTKELSNQPTEYYGIDLAKSVDWTVIIGMDKQGNTTQVHRFQKDWLQTKETIISVCHKHKPIVIDSTGVGDAIVEDLQKHFQKMHGFKYTSTSKQQLMEGLASSIHKGEISYPTGVVKDELEIFEYVFTSTGVKYSAPQGFHDDCVNALALANRCRIEHKGYGTYIIR